MDRNIIKYELMKFKIRNFIPKMPLKVLKKHTANIHSTIIETLFQIVCDLKELKCQGKKILNIIFTFYSIHYSFTLLQSPHLVPL